MLSCVWYELIFVVMLFNNSTLELLLCGRMVPKISFGIFTWYSHIQDLVCCISLIFFFTVLLLSLEVQLGGCKGLEARD